MPLPRLATQVMLGKTLKELDPWSMRRSGYVSVKESVFPFRRFPGVDILLGPEMRSTGEVMGIAPTFEEAFLKGQWGAGQKLPEGGKVFLSVNDRDKRFVAEVARQYVDLGFELLATSGTAGLLAGQGIPSTRVLKVYEGRPNIVDLIKNGEVSLVINTASGKRTAHDSKAIRQATLHYGVPYSTTLSGAKAIARAIGAARTTEVRVKSFRNTIRASNPREGLSDREALPRSSPVESLFKEGAVLRVLQEPEVFFIISPSFFEKIPGLPGRRRKRYATVMPLYRKACLFRSACGLSRKRDAGIPALVWGGRLSADGGGTLPGMGQSLAGLRQAYNERPASAGVIH